VPDWLAPWRLDPDILLVDEPSAGLDPITRRDRRAAGHLKKKGTTLVVVTHNIPSARHVGDELAMLIRDASIAQGTARSSIAATTRWCARSCDPRGQGKEAIRR
jgi:ABC-type transporter Mla maintaining outer membrane lipid asymmetry ATPase subunit MlaF